MIQKIPKFKSLEEERRFWDTHSITEFLDELEPASIMFAKPQKKLVSLRLDEDQIASLKKVASSKHLGYLTLIRSWIADRLTQEHRLLSQHAH